MKEVISMNKHNLHNTLLFLSEQLHSDTIKYNWNSKSIFTYIAAPTDLHLPQTC